MVARRSVLGLVPPAELTLTPASAADGLLVEAARMPAPNVALDARGQLLLATWLSPAFPVGAFSYSHGIETAIADGRIRSESAAAEWIAAVLLHGSGWNDAVVLAATWRAVAAADLDALVSVAALAKAMSPSAERSLEAIGLGTAFLKAVASAWPALPLGRAVAATDEAVPYPVAIGIAAAAHGLPLEATLNASLNGFVASLVSVTVRLVPLGQTAGLRIQAGLQPRIADMAARATASTLDDLGSGAMLSDIASMRHETLYSRVFRS